MDKTFDLPDSTDWLDTTLPSVAPLENALRCQICKDFFNTPVITSCSHTFCSLCIRRCLSAEGKCPTCRASDQEVKLRRNAAVQEIVESFQNARPNVLELARQSQTTATAEEGDEDLPQPATKRRRLQEPMETIAPMQPETRRTRSQMRQVEPAPILLSDPVEDIRDADYVPDDGLVPCPMCNRRMKEQAVFNHLDKCTGQPQERNTQPPPRTMFTRAPQQSFPSLSNRAPAKPLERLPTLNYSLFKDQVLRKKMKDLGIPDWGSRTLLQRRHTEWMNLWNANCDAKTPKTKEELRRDLDVWERSQGGAAPQQYSTGPNTVMAKNFDAAAWSTDHGDDFKQLIANAKKKRNENRENKDNAQTAQNLEETTVHGSTDYQQQQQDPISMPLSNVNGENHVIMAESPPPNTEALTALPGIGEMLRNAPVLPGPYAPAPAPFVLNGDVINRAEGDSNDYPAI